MFCICMAVVLALLAVSSNLVKFVLFFSDMFEDFRISGVVSPISVIMESMSDDNFSVAISLSVLGSMNSVIFAFRLLIFFEGDKISPDSVVNTITSNTSSPAK